MRTIIHIGQHKTGTTSIQHFLQYKRVELAKQGLYVPDSLMGFKNPSHFILNVYALNQNRFSTMKENLLKSKPIDYFIDLNKNLEKNISEHYLYAKKQGCEDIIWSNEGLYLLNSIEEYKRLRNLFDKYSSRVVCVCCFREVKSYRASYMEELRKKGLSHSNDKDSSRYLRADSWLFDYARKKRILRQVFDEVIIFSYDPIDNVSAFLGQIGYSASDTESARLNVTKYITNIE